MSFFATASNIKGSRSQETQEGAAITWEVRRVPRVVLHYYLVSAVAVLVNTLQEFACVPRSHAIISRVVWRQWTKSLFLDILAKFLPSLRLLVL
jgi:hypothetical protein